MKFCCRGHGCKLSLPLLSLFRKSGCVQQSSSVVEGLGFAISLRIVLPVAKAWIGFHRAFTTLVADSQFSTLGVTLISVLARVRRIIGQRDSTTRGLDMDGGVKRQWPPDVRDTRQVEGEAMLKERVEEDIGRVVERRIESEKPRIADAAKGGSMAMQLKAADVADQSKRSAVDGNKQEATAVQEKVEQLEVGRDRVQGRPKKRRKKSNAIDDLFGDLL